MGICFRHGTHVRYVVSHDSVGEGEGGSGSIGKVTDHQTIWRKGWGEREREREREREGERIKQTEVGKIGRE